MHAPVFKAIADTEPDVTRQVAALLGKLRDGALPAEQLTSKAQAALGAPALQQLAAALKPCSAPPALELLARSTKGEDRNYLYRTVCGDTPMHLEINFNKASRIDHLAIKPQR